MSRDNKELSFRRVDSWTSFNLLSTFCFPLQLYCLPLLQIIFPGNSKVFNGTNGNRRAHPVLPNYALLFQQKISLTGR